MFLCAMFVLSAHATTVNIDWLMDGATYAQTTCETGGNFTLPTPTPTKYGYHFVGWQQNDAVGSWSQSGTPTPTNPIEPTFRQFGNTVLRALGSGDNFIADSYDPTTGKITRRVGVKVLDGTENISIFTSSGRTSVFLIHVSDTGGLGNGYTSTSILSTRFVASNTIASSSMPNNSIFERGDDALEFFVRQDDYDNNLNGFKQFLADQYAAGTPVIIVYPLATPVEENYSAQ